MLTEQRARQLRRLCLVAPALSAASAALLMLTPVHGLVLRAVQTSAPGVAPLAEAAPFAGWILLTLGCSAITAYDLVHREKRSNTSLTWLSIAGTALVFYSHVFAIAIAALGIGLLRSFHNL